MTHTFDYALFQSQFPAYASAPVQAVLQVYWDVGTTFVDPNDNYCGGLKDNVLQYALNLMVAHQAYINALVESGQTTVVVTGSTIDKVSVSLLAPPVKDGFQFWLQTSPYGQQLSALLRAQFAGGFYQAVGLPERRAFRKVYGTFR